MGAFDVHPNIPGIESTVLTKYVLRIAFFVKFIFEAT